MSWQQLLSILRENDDNAAAEQQPPTTCPLSGDLLQTHYDGGLICPFEGWRPGR